MHTYRKISSEEREQNRKDFEVALRIGTLRAVNLELGFTTANPRCLRVGDIVKFADCEPLWEYRGVLNDNPLARYFRVFSTEDPNVRGFTLPTSLCQQISVYRVWRKK